MGNFLITSNTSYDPISFQEMWQPAMYLRQQHDLTETALGELESEASVWGGLADKVKDEKTYTRYKSYIDKLQEAADDLSKNGINNASKKTLNTLKGQFKSQIQPIEEAYKKREAWIAAQRAGKAVGQIYDIDASTMSLDNFIFDKINDYNIIDTKAKQKEAEDLYSMIANDLNASVGMSGPRVDAYHKTFKQKYGITAQEASKFLSDVRSGNLNLADPTLLNIYNTIWGGSGIENWKGNQTANRRLLQDAILRGVRTAVGKDAYQMYDDKAAIADLEVETARRKAAIANGDSNESGKIKYGNRQSKTKHEIEQAEADWKQLRGYVYTDKKTGQLTFTNAGRKKWASEKDGIITTHTPSSTGGGSYTTKENSDFVKVIKKYDLQNMLEGNTRTPMLSDRLLELSKIANNQADLLVANEKFMTIDPSQYDNLLGNILVSADSDGNINNKVKARADDGSVYFKDGSAVNISSLKSSDISGARVVSGTAGDYIEINTKNNGTIVRMLQNMDSSYQGLTAKEKLSLAKLYEAQENGIQFVTIGGKTKTVDDAIIDMTGSNIDKGVTIATRSSKSKPNEVSSSLSF